MPTYAPIRGPAKRPSEKEVSSSWSKLKGVPKRALFADLNFDDAANIISVLLTTASRYDPDPTGATSLAQPLAITRAKAAQELLSNVIKPTGKLSELAKQEAGDALRVIFKGLPNKVIKKISSMEHTPEQATEVWNYTDRPPYPTAEFGKHRGIAGLFYPSSGKTGYFGTSSPNYPYSLADVVAHEGGHAAHRQMAERMGDPFKFYQSMENKEEIADYLAEAMMKKAGLEYVGEFKNSKAEYIKQDAGNLSPYQVLRDFLMAIEE